MQLILGFSKNHNKEHHNLNETHYKNIICPKCQKNIMINFNDYKITLSQCSEGHCIQNLLLNNLTLDIGYQVGVRFVILLVAVVLVLFNVYMYVNTIKPGKKIVKEEKKKEEVKAEVKEEKVTTKKTTITKKMEKSSRVPSILTGIPLQRLVAL